MVYKLPVRKRDVFAEPSSAEPQWQRSMGELFRPQVKALPGRGRVCGTDHAVKACQQYGLLDTRKILHGTEHSAVDEPEQHQEATG